MCKRQRTLVLRDLHTIHFGTIDVFQPFYLPPSSWHLLIFSSLRQERVFTHLLPVYRAD